MEITSGAVYFVLGVITPLLLLIRSQLLCYLKAFAYFISNYHESQLSYTVTPAHLAVLCLEDSAVDFNGVINIVDHAIRFGIKRISFYDPWSIFLNNRDKLSELIIKTLKSRGVASKIAFDEDLPVEGATHVHFLGPEHGIEGLVRACKSFSSSTEKITPAMITDYLSAEGIYEPDLLLRIGPSSYSFLAGYPPFSLRTTEIVDAPALRFESTDDFKRILHQFSKRDRRLGR